MDEIGVSGLTWNGVGRSEEDLQDLCRNVEQHYEEVVLEKKEGGERVIHKPSDELASVQEGIHKTYLQKAEWPKWLFGAGDGRAQRQNAKAHLGLNHHFVTDILSFYPSVSHRDVYDVFDSKINFTTEAARLATRLTTYQGELPQGTITSPRLADLAFLDIDRKLNSFCESRGIVYTRYADDLTFSSGSSFKQDIPEIKKIVSRSDFRLHEGKKTSYKIGPIEVTGVIVTNNGLFAPPRLKKRLEELDPKSEEESDKWIGTLGYVRYIEPTFERWNIDAVDTISSSTEY